MHFFTTATSHFGIYVSHLVDNIGEGRPKWMYLSCTVQVPFINTLVLSNCYKYNLK